MYHKTSSFRIFNGFNIVLLSLLALLCVIPLVHVLAVSVSSSEYVNANRITFVPMGFTLENYARTFTSNGFMNALGITFLRTILGTALSMLLCFLAAFSLSKEDSYFKGRSIYAWFFVITILFHGGLIPSYLVVVNTGLKNTIWALILPGAVAVFNVVLMMNFFRGIPKELEEAAQIDGAGIVRTLFMIFLPISMPSIATLSLFTIVTHWNSWFDGMIYMEANRQPLATFIQSMIKNTDFTKIHVNPSDLRILSERALKATQIFVGALPVLLVYPFLQRYFVHGMTLGSVKE